MAIVPKLTIQDSFECRAKAQYIVPGLVNRPVPCEHIEPEVKGLAKKLSAINNFDLFLLPVMYQL